MNSLVSIIIPVFNVEKYVSNCLESVVNQDYNNIEIIVVDDGSTDGSKEIVEQYAERDGRIVVISQKNRGLSNARNTGVQEASGEYVMFVDSDDFISEYMVSRFLAVSEMCGADYVCSESLNFLDGDEYRAKELVNKCTNQEVRFAVFDKTDALKKMFYQKPSITGAYLKLYKKELLEKIAFPDNRYYEDMATTYKFIQNAKCIAFIEEKYYAYRIRENSIMSQKFSEKKMDCIWVSEQIEKDFFDATVDVKEAVESGLFRLNRLVFVQTPILSSYSKQVFAYIKRYRKVTLFNNNLRTFERWLALISYFGSVAFRLALIIFTLLRKQDIKHSVLAMSRN